MQQFYHLTNQDNARKILKDGLKKGRDVGIQKVCYGIPTNNNYIYLSKKRLAGFSLDTYPDGVLLRVKIPDNHPLERDKDVATFIEGSLEKGNVFGVLEALDILAKLGLKSTDGKLDISKENIELHIDGMSKEAWDIAVGFYRTSQNIPPNCDEYVVESIYPRFI